jgi:hypothetical protein
MDIYQPSWQQLDELLGLEQPHSGNPTEEHHEVFDPLQEPQDPAHLAIHPDDLALLDSITVAQTGARPPQRQTTQRSRKPVDPTHLALLEGLNEGLSRSNRSNISRFFAYLENQTLHGSEPLTFDMLRQP